MLDAGNIEIRGVNKDGSKWIVNAELGKKGAILADFRLKDSG